MYEFMKFEKKVLVYKTLAQDEEDPNGFNVKISLP